MQVKLCRYCTNMESFGDEGSMHCKYGLSRGDKTALTCQHYQQIDMCCAQVSKDHKAHKEGNFTPLPKRVIETNNGEILVVKTKLTEKVDIEEYAPISAEVIFSYGSIKVKVPEVETYSDPPGESIPILVEQAGGKLFLRAWDETEEDPVINKSWERKEVTT